MEEKKTIIVSDDYLHAEELHKRVKATVHSMKISFVELGKMLKEMRDGKLYKELGYQNFEDYCKTEVEINRRYAYELIGIAEKLPEDFVRSAHKIGVKKLSLLAMLNPEQREEVIQTVNVESVTVKELQSQISQMKTRQKQDAEKITELTLEKEEIYQQMEAVQERIDGLEAEKQQAQKRIEELESKPIEHYSQSVEELKEIERLTTENNQLKIENEALEEQRTELETKINELDSPLTSGENRHKVEAEIAQAINNATKGLIAQNQSMQEQNQRDIQKIHQGYQKEIAELKKQIAEKSDIPEESPQMKAFKIRLAALADSIELLVKFLCENPEMSYLDKSGQVLKGAENSLTEIRKQVQE